VLGCSKVGITGPSCSHVSPDMAPRRVQVACRVQPLASPYISVSMQVFHRVARRADIYGSE
jgi:hypothetical protein